MAVRIYYNITKITKFNINVVIIVNEYKERLGYNLLSELQTQTLQNLNSRFLSAMKLQNETSTIKSVFKTDDFQMIMVKLHRTYCNPSNVDKIACIQDSANETKILIRSQIQKTIGLGEHLIVWFY